MSTEKKSDKEIKAPKNKLLLFLLLSYLVFFFFCLLNSLIQGFYPRYWPSLSDSLPLLIFHSPIFVIFSIFLFFGWKFWKNGNWKRLVFLWALPFIIFYGISVIYFSLINEQGVFQCGLYPFKTITEFWHTDSTDITDSVLKNEQEMAYLLTIDRLTNQLNTPLDRQVVPRECQKNIRFRWNNKSSVPITIKGLPIKQEIIISPQDSYTEVFVDSKTYPYLLNKYPGLIHVNQDSTNRPISEDLVKFCQDNARGEVLVVFRSEVDEGEVANFFNQSGLVLIDQKPYNSFLAKPSGEKSLSQILDTLKTHPQFGRMDYDCSFFKTEIVNNGPANSSILSEDFDKTRRYTNIVYHYQITLPNDWQIDQNSYGELIMFRDHKLSEQELDTSDIIQGMKLEIYALKKDSNQDLDQLINRSYGGNADSIISRENKIINGFESVQVVDDFMNFSINTFFDRGSVIILVSGIVGNKDHQEYTDKYQNILSTFKFTD